MSWCGVVLLSQERCKRIGLNTIKHVRACRQIRDPREVLNSAETHQGARPELTAQRLIGELVQSLQQRLTGELVQNLERRDSPGSSSRIYSTETHQGARPEFTAQRLTKELVQNL